MQRRQFITLLGSTVAWPCALHGEPSVMPTVGFINASPAQAYTRLLSAFRKGLDEAGYVEGRNVAIEYHWLEGQYDTAKLQVLMADLSHRQVAVIVASGSATIALAAKKETSSIPIVFGVFDDPVKSELVSSVDHPEGNVTGSVDIPTDPTPRQLGLLHELLPQASRIGVLIHPAPAGVTDFTQQAAQDTAEDLRLQIIPIRAGSPPAIDGAFRALSEARADAVLIPWDAYYTSRTSQIVALTQAHRLPAVCGARELAEAGVLASYAPDQNYAFLQVGLYTGAILNGKKPAELPVVRTTQLELVINRRIAKTLGLQIPPTVLARADEVID